MAKRIIIGIDEVGRGPWAGPLTAAAVAMDADMVIDGLNDSKKLTAGQRADLFREIAASALSVGIGWCGQRQLDECGLQAATSTAMATALKQVAPIEGEVVVDGSYNYLGDVPGVKTVIGADGFIPAVSAASIVAKHLRDMYMCKLALVFPGYGFELHKGYGTKAHRQAIENRGICTLHRRSFAPVKLFLGG